MPIPYLRSMRDRRDHTNRVPKRDFFSSFASRFTRPGATMSREGADRAPPMRKRVRAARLTLAHASGLRYALGDRRGRPLSRFRSSASRQRHPRSSPQTSSTRGGFPRFRDAPDHGLPPTRGVRWPVEIPRTHRRVASRSARFPRVRARAPSARSETRRLRFIRSASEKAPESVCANLASRRRAGSRRRSLPSSHRD